MDFSLDGMLIAFEWITFSEGNPFTENRNSRFRNAFCNDWGTAGGYYRIKDTGYGRKEKEWENERG